MNSPSRKKWLPAVEGGSELRNRIRAGDNIQEIFVYAGDIPRFDEAPRGSDYRMAVLELPTGISPTAVSWPVKGFEILVWTYNYGELAIRLLVSELFGWDATRVTVITNIKFYGVYSAQEESI